MTDLFTRNLESLRRRYPELAERVSNHQPSQAVRMVASESGQWDLCHATDDGQERLFYGVPNPLEDAQAYWRGKTLRNPALMVFLGIDLGYRLFAYLANPNPNTQVYVVIEESLDIFCSCLQVADLSQLLHDPRFNLLISVPRERLFIELRLVLETTFTYSLIRAVFVESSSTSYRINTPYYKQALVALRDAAKDLFLFAGNSPLDTFIGTRNMLLNLEVIAREPGLVQAFGKFSGKPGVIVATGPSLDKNYKLLSEIQDRAVLVSVDASLKFLLRSGIRPHFVTCLERVAYSAKFFEGIEPEACRETVQVAAPVVMPEVYAAYPGPKAILFRSLYHFAWLRLDKGTIATGHSSANMAFKLLESLGCDPIVLVGQDLAYSDEGDTHASAAPWGRSQDGNRPQQTGAFPVRGNLRETVLTNGAWDLFRTCYERDVASYRGTVINATEGGAYIEGTRVETLRNTIDHSIGEPFSPAEQIQTLLQRPTKEEADRYLEWVRTVHIPDTLSGIRKVSTGFTRMAKQIRKALGRDTRQDKLEELLKEAYAFWVNQMRDDVTFQQSSVQALQSTFVQVRTDYFDVPNRLNHVVDISRARLELLANCMTSMAGILEKLEQLYADPENTPAE